MRIAAVVVALASLMALPAAEARSRASTQGSGLPYMDVQRSCMDAQRFSTDDKKLAYRGCMQDELAAKDQLSKKWSSFKVKDRQNCFEQARMPSPSYVEVLTCLEMDSDAMVPASGGKPSPQIGGPVAPGLSTGAAGAPAAN